MAVDAEFAPPPPPPPPGPSPGSERTPSPTFIRAQGSRSPPSKRQRGRSTPPPSPGLPSPPPRSSSTPPRSPASPSRGEATPEATEELPKTRTSPTSPTRAGATPEATKGFPKTMSSPTSPSRGEATPTSLTRAEGLKTRTSPTSPTRAGATPEATEGFPKTMSSPTSPTREEAMPTPLMRGGDVLSKDESMTASSQDRLRSCRAKLDYEAENRKPSPVAIFWDIENCHVPSDVEPRDVSSHVRRVLRNHENFSGAVVKFCACGDFKLFPRRVKEGLEGSGVEIVDCPHEDKKEAADKVILVKMILAAYDNNVPLSILLISGDSDYALVLKELHDRQFIIGLAVLSSINVSSDLSMSAKIVWDWTSLAHGVGSGMPRPLPCPGDLEVLKADMFQLLDSTRDGRMMISAITGAYAEHFLRPLVLPYYGVDDVEELFKKLGTDSFLLNGSGKKMMASINGNFALQQAEQLGCSTAAVLPLVLSDKTAKVVNTEASLKGEGAEAERVQTIASSQATGVQTIASSQATGVQTIASSQAIGVQTIASSQATGVPKPSKKSRRRHRRR